VLKTCGLNDSFIAAYLAAITVNNRIWADSATSLRYAQNDGWNEPQRLRPSDFEGNHILALASAVDADIIVSDDTDLTQLSPWQGRPIIRPRDFVARYVNAPRARG